MKLGNLVISFAFILLIAPVSQSQLTDDAKTAIYQKDVYNMLVSSNKSIENEKAIIDAFCYEVDLNEFSYEQLKQWQKYAKSSVISKILGDAISKKVIEIINEIRSLTAEEFKPYYMAYPERQTLLNQFVDKVLIPNISELSLEELVYYDDYLPEEYHSKFADEICTRSNEIRELLGENLPDYRKFENLLADRLKYSIEYIIWTCFVEGHKQLNNAYAQIGFAPDDPQEAAYQYQSLVNACFPTKMVQETIQKEIDNFCTELNKTRMNYFRAYGKDKYPKLGYKVPQLELNSNASIEPLREISKARERFIRNREDISTGTSVLGWLFGPAVGLISRGIGDWMAIDGLVESEYTARKTYMKGVQKQLLTSFANYSNRIISAINKLLK